ncbi:G-protein coupled receptor 4-like [Haplochromis burtoni]|uniref:G-protein coupled receptor 4-like n=1 Tax=Haplochromis burtoni TaxID=8153 RepID=UPI001C2D7F4C|nr:G-protein coupled receptor 4-like [Haplochromis burtoni]
MRFPTLPIPHNAVVYTGKNPITGSHGQEQYFLEVVMWINMCVCLPLTILIIYCVSYMVQKSQVSIIYYTNLLITNLIQICIMTLWVTRVESIITIIIYYCVMMANLYFRMCIALERYFSITHPLLDCVRNTKSSVVVCVLVWAFCIVSVTLAIVLHEFQRLLVYAALPAPVFILCSTQSCRALAQATSMSTEEKNRILGTLTLSSFNYFLGTLPTMIFHILVMQSYVNWIVFLLVPFVELILFLFIFSACVWCVDSTASDEEYDDECGLL